MANKNTKRNRVANGYKRTCGRAVNSSEERRVSGRAQYKAPTIVKGGEAVHPVSGLTTSQIQHIIS